MSSYKDVRSHRMLFDRQSLVELGTRHKLIMDVMKAGIVCSEKLEPSSMKKNYHYRVTQYRRNN